ncbi:DnaA ATPase domain-containing protein [Streptomyces sp. NPDC054784]
MHSASPDPSPQQQWLDDRRHAALDGFDDRTPPLYRPSVPLPAAVAAWAARAEGAPASLFLTGAVGVGKTHTAWHAARAWLDREQRQQVRSPGGVRVWRSTQLFDALRPEGDDPRGVTREAQTAGLLFLDDLAAARVSPSGWTQERLYEIFDERYTRQRPVLITCDVLPNQLGDIVGDRVASRLAEMCRGGIHLMRGVDRRTAGAA